MRNIWSSVIAVLFLVAVGEAGIAQPASASWAEHNVGTGAPATVDGVDGLPDGRVATLLQRSTGRPHTLEFRIGRRHTVVATSADGFNGATWTTTPEDVSSSYSYVSGTVMTMAGSTPGLRQRGHNSLRRASTPSRQG